MRILVIQGHPDPEGGHFDHALATAYEDAARQAGHEVDVISVATLEFTLLRSQQAWKESEPPEDIHRAQSLILGADHLVIIYPLWLGTLPALLKGFFEQVFRPDYAISMDPDTGRWSRLLKGRSARVVVTMGMPGFAYRLFYRAHSLKSLERNILKFVGIKPVRETIFGGVETSARSREKYLRKMTALGKAGA